MNLQQAIKKQLKTIRFYSDPAGRTINLTQTQPLRETFRLFVRVRNKIN